jgi:hypothetical protein
VTISLRNLPPEVQKAIEETSRRNRISLNKGNDSIARGIAPKTGEKQ